MTLLWIVVPMGAMIAVLGFLVESERLRKIDLQKIRLRNSGFILDSTYKACNPNVFIDKNNFNIATITTNAILYVFEARSIAKVERRKKNRYRHDK